MTAQQVMKEMDSELVYPNDEMIAAWADLRPDGAATLAQQLKYNVDPVKAVSRSVTSVMRHGEYVKVLMKLRQDYVSDELEIDAGGWSCFGELVDKIVSDMEHQQKTYGTMSRATSRSKEAATLFADGFNIGWGCILVILPYIDRPDIEWASKDRVELCGQTSTPLSGNWGSMNS